MFYMHTDNTDLLLIFIFVLWFKCLVVYSYWKKPKFCKCLAYSENKTNARLEMQEHVITKNQDTMCLLEAEKSAVPAGCRIVSRRSSIEKEVVSWRYNHQHQSRLADGRRWLQICKGFSGIFWLREAHALSVRGYGSSTQVPSDVGF